MVMASLRVVDVGVNASLKDFVESCRLSGRELRSLVNLDVQECRDMTQVEDTSVSQLDWLLLKVLVGQHSLGDNVPARPEGLPILDGGQG